MSEKKIDKRQPVATKCAGKNTETHGAPWNISVIPLLWKDGLQIFVAKCHEISLYGHVLLGACQLGFKLKDTKISHNLSHPRLPNFTSCPQSIQNWAEAKSINKITPQDDQNARGMRKNPGDEAGIKLPLIPCVSVLILNNSVSRTTSHAKPWQTTRTPWPGTTVPLQTHEGRKQLRRSSSQNPREVSRATFSVRLSITFHVLSFPFSCILCKYLCVTSLLHPFSSMFHSSNNWVQLTSYLQLHSASAPFRKLQMEMLQLLTLLVQYSQSKNGCETQLVSI